MTDLSVIIVNWNTRELLRGCLDSLPAATAGLQVETFVVDNASHDGSAALLRGQYPRCRLIEAGRNVGFSAGNNLALREASGRHVLLLNPDTVCRPNSLARLVAFVDATADAGAAGPLLTTPAGEPTISWGNFPAARFHLCAALDPRGTWLPAPRANLRFTQVPRRDEPTRAVDYAMGACLLIRGEALRAVGPLDERFFMYFEETDWCRRAARAGWRVYYFAGAEVVHLEGRAADQVSDFSRRQFHHSYRLFVAKHYGPRRVWRFRAALGLEYSAKALLRGLAPGDCARNRALARAHWATARLQWRGRIEPVPPV